MTQDDQPAESRNQEVLGWYDQHGPALLAYAVSLVGDRGTAEDLLHQLFLRLLGSSRVQPGEARPYLFRAIRNAALNSRRATVRDVPLEEHRYGWLEAPAELIEAGVALEKGLRELPQEQREVIVMRIWGEMKLEEIACIVEAPLNTVASRYRYGLARLREALGVTERKKEYGSR